MGAVRRTSRRLLQHAMGRPLTRWGATDRALADAIAGRLVLVTGASAGIGRALALRCGRVGATVVLVARSGDRLAEVRDEIVAAGGTAHVHPCDLADLEAVDRLAADVVARHGPVEVLVNNAGRSIRRSVASSLDRFHDLERTLELNYLGAVRLIHGLLPAMLDNGHGHVVNISTMAVKAHPPRFSAYLASKQALNAYGRTLATELHHRDIAVTAVHMPLVRTDMIAPTRIYDRVPALSPQDATDLVARAITRRPTQVLPLPGRLAAVAHAVAPGTYRLVMNRVNGLVKRSEARDPERPVWAVS